MYIILEFGVTRFKLRNIDIGSGIEFIMMEPSTPQRGAPLSIKYNTI